MENIDDIVLFVEVARAKGFTKAAEKLGIPQSTLSRRMTDFEKSLGLQLLTRTTRKVELSEAGRYYFERVLPIVEEIRRVHDEMSGIRERPHGVLRVSLPVDFAYELLAPLLPEFAAQYPEISLEMDLTPRKVDLVGEPFDLVIRAGDLADSGYIATPVMQVNAFLYAAPSYLAKHGAPQAPQEINPAHCLRFSGLERWRLFDQTGQMQEIRAQSRYAVNSVGMVQRMAEQGMGVALLADVVARAAEADGRLQKILPSWQAPPSQITALTTTRLLPAKSKCFIEFLKAKAE
ncbi:LysR family transcriptional regulator [Aggregatibacter actinomycetemcomitans]|nr:LysR family transcriptional regulator [Aggregatibacter actinomycetemcomitans]